MAAEIEVLRQTGELIIAAERRPGASGKTSVAAFEAPAARAGGVYLHASNVHVKVAFTDILAVEADGDYSRLHLSDGRVFHELRSLREWETVLPPREFLRVHRRHLVSFRHLHHLRRAAGGRWHVAIAGLPRPIAVGRQFQSALKHALALRGT